MKKLVCVLVALTMVMCMAGRSEASKVNYNLNKRADYFDYERKITV